MLKVRDLTARGPHGQTLEGVSFTVEPGKLTAVIGPSLSGKQLLADLLGGRSQPEKGEIVVNHYHLTSSDLRAKAQLGYLSGEPAIEPFLTGYEWLNVLGAIYRLNPAKRRSRIVELLEQLKLQDDAYSLVERMHPSIIQKLAFAGAYVHQPKCIVLTEPLQYLDWSDSERLITFIKHEIPRTSTVLISDDLALVQALADEIIILDQGRVVASGTLKQLINQVKPARSDIDAVYYQLFSA